MPLIDTYSISGKFKAKVDTTTGPINGKTYEESAPDKNLKGGVQGSFDGIYDGATSVLYTGVHKGGSLTTVASAANMDAGFEILGTDLTGDILMISLTVLSEIGDTQGGLIIRVGSSTLLRPLAVGESMTIPFNSEAIGGALYTMVNVYAPGTIELTFSMAMFGPV